MPVRKVWDHAIDLKKDFKVSKAKVYPLSRNKREEMQKFVEEHLKKGYIRPSKSQQTLPVFFVGKKDGGKRMVVKVDSVPGPELSQLPSKSALTKRTR